MNDKSSCSFLLLAINFLLLLRRIAGGCRRFILWIRLRSDSFHSHNVDKVISNIASAIDLRDPRPEEFDITKHSRYSVSLDGLGLRSECAQCVPFFPSYRLDVHVMERLTPLFAVAVEDWIHDHPHCHVWQMLAEHFM